MNRERGVALLMVLVVLTTLSALLYPLWQAQRMSIARAQASQGQMQAWAVLISAQDWVRSALKFDAQLSKIDSLTEMWAQPMPPIPFDGGQVSGWLEDAQSKLNVNALAAPDGVQREAVVQRFNRLCQVLQVDCPFWPAVADWIDHDDIPMTGGAETSFYMGQPTPMRPANQEVVAVEELSVVAGVTPSVLQLLKPYLVALPVVLPINMNTVTAPVLMAQAPWITEEIAKRVLAQQRLQPFESVTQISDAWRQAGVSDVDLAPLMNGQVFDVKTSYFLLHSQAEYGGHRWQMAALLARSVDKTSAIARWLEETSIQ